MTPVTCRRFLATLRSSAPWVACLALALTATAARGQQVPTGGAGVVDAGVVESQVRYRVGAEVVAGAAPLERIDVYLAVPLECPEQSVVKVDEQAEPPGVDIAYRDLDGARQMVISISQLAAGQRAAAYATFDVRTRTTAPPTETAALAIPRRVDRSLRHYLAASPFIDVNSPVVRAAVAAAWAELGPPPAGATGDWERVAALYDYAQRHVAYQLGDDKSSLAALKDGVGDCQAIAAVFVALCRTAKIPARMVWVDGHQYAEFYLESTPGTGQWYPVESAGSRSFGFMPLARVILQKGDNFQVPERRREKLRYASDYAVMPVPPRAAPAVKYIRQRVP
jgi:hypothetical protein